MPINFVTGLPRAGKTLFAISMVKERAEREKRQVYTCNIPDVTIAGWDVIDHPDKWMELPDSCIILVDELQDFWPKSAAGSRVPEPILELSKHGKRGIDFYIITQEPDLVHTTPRSLCEFHYFVIRAFGSQNAMVHKFQRMQLHPEKVKKNAEKIPFRYPREAFGKIDKSTGEILVKPWYKSADVHNIKRSIPVKIFAIPILLLFVAFCIWGAYKLMGGTLNKARGGTAATSSMIPGSGAQPMPPAAPSKAPMTSVEYAASFVPRFAGMPQTAPRYDALNEPKTSPMPAACIEGIRPGTKKITCRCYTQQATHFETPEDLCRQIVRNGFFDDRLPPVPPVAPVAQAPAVGEPGQGAASFGSDRRPDLRAAAETAVGDADVRQFMKKSKHFGG